MILWRISNYADLSGRGGMLASGRWHSQGAPIVYCCDHPSTALLEMLVHVDLEDLPTHFQLLKINCPGDIGIQLVEPMDMGNEDLARETGDRWLSRGEHCLLKVPSVILPAAGNILVNPRHADTAKLTIETMLRYPFDSRLLK